MRAVFRDFFTGNGKLKKLIDKMYVNYYDGAYAYSSMLLFCQISAMADFMRNLKRSSYKNAVFFKNVL